MKDEKIIKVKLKKLLGYIRDGNYVIPNFQREFEWQPLQVRDLIQSIFLDYYIGSLLLLKGKENNFKVLACKSIYGLEENSNRLNIVLDGQERLTAMYFAFFVPTELHPNRANTYRYFVRVDQFIEQVYDDAFFYEYGDKGERLLRDKENQFKQNIFPVSVMGDSNEMHRWLRDYKEYWREKVVNPNSEQLSDTNSVASKHVKNAELFFEFLFDLTDQYIVSFIELDKDIDIYKVCKIFTQINSKGTRLDIFDLINALLTPQEIELKQMYQKAKKELSFVGSDRMNVYLLQVMSIFRQNYCSPKYLYYLIPGQERKIRDNNGQLISETLISDKSVFIQDWTDAVESMKKVVTYLKSQEYGVISTKYIPYASILPPFAALIKWTEQNISHIKKSDAMKKICRWYWISVFLKRYTGSVQSTIAKDFIDVTNWIEFDVEPSFYTEVKTRISSIDLFEETKGGTSIYNGVFNLLIRNNAKDWYTEQIFHHNQYDDIDDHHIVPKSWGTGKKFNMKFSIDTILNRTPLTSEINKFIGKKLPNEYLPELIEDKSEETMRSILESHFISKKAFDVLMKENFDVGDYEEFVRERESTMRNAIVKAMGIT